jgi:hypothetical protein
MDDLEVRIVGERPDGHLVLPGQRQRSISAPSPSFLEWRARGW